jgi:hypothetical protein
MGTDKALKFLFFQLCSPQFFLTLLLSNSTSVEPICSDGILLNFLFFDYPITWWL